MSAIADTTQRGKISESAALEQGKDVVKQKAQSTANAIEISAYDFLAPIANKVRQGKLSASDAHKFVLNHVANKIYQAKRQVKNVTTSIKDQLLKEGSKLSNINTDIFAERLRQLLIELNHEPKVRKSIASISLIMNDLKDMIIERVENVKSTAKQDLNSNQILRDELTSVFDDLSTLVERFAGGHSIDPIINIIAGLIESYSDDETVRQTWDEVTQFFTWASDQGLEEASDEFYWRSRNVIFRLRRLAHTKYQDQWDGLRREFDQLVESIRHDRYVGDFIDNLESLASDATLMSKDGVLNLQSGLYLACADLGNLSMGMFSTWKYLPLPRIQHSSPKVDFKIDNLAIPVKECLPEYMTVNYTGDAYLRAIASPGEHQLELSPYNHGTEQFIDIKIKGLRISAEEMAFYMNKKTGCFRVEDSGLANISTNHRGMDIDLVLRRLHPPEQRYFTQHYRRSSTGVFGNKTFPWVCTIVPRPHERRFEIDNIRVDLHHLNISVSNTKHDWFYGFLLWLFKGTVRKQVAEMIKDAMSDGIDQLDIMKTDQLHQLDQNTKQSLEPINDQIKSSMSDSFKAVGSLANYILSPSSDSKLGGNVPKASGNLPNKQGIVNNIQNTANTVHQNVQGAGEKLTENKHAQTQQLCRGSLLNEGEAV